MRVRRSLSIDRKSTRLNSRHYLISVVASFFFLITRRPPRSTLFPYPALFRSRTPITTSRGWRLAIRRLPNAGEAVTEHRSEEHTSELPSLPYLCRRFFFFFNNTATT